MVGKSKVISGLNDWQAHRRRKDTIMGSSVGPDAYAQTREPKGTIGELFQPTFHAGLTNNDSGKTPGGNFLEATVVRGTSATYVDRNGILQLAAPNESRQEYANGQPLGTLMEPAITNKCTNHNANPDAALINLTTGGGTEVLSRVSDPAAIAGAGLGNICTDGNMIEIAGGAAGGYVFVQGATTAADHTISVYAYMVTGTGNLTFSGAGVPTPEAIGPSLSRVDVSWPSATAGRFLQISVTANAVCRFVLNQMEEQPVASSPIITSGAAASRDVDQLSWPLDSILNQSQGMVALTWRPGFNDADIVGSGFADIRLLRLGTDASQLMYFQKDLTSGENRFYAWDGTDFTSAPVTGGVVANRDYLITVHWAGAEKQIAFKANGAWVESPVETYDGQWNAASVLDLLYFTGTLNAPSWARNAYFWDENKGLPWLKSFFSGIAN